MLRNRIAMILGAALLLTVLLMAGCGNATPTTTVAPLSLTTTSFPNATIGISYSQTIQASGGSSPYTWSIIEGSLPGGFSFSSRTGSISGMPMNPGTYSFTVQVTDSVGTVVTRPLSITINEPITPLTAGTSYLTTGEEGVAYSQTLKAYGGRAPYTWEISGGTLPEGVELNGAVLSGTPRTAGKYIIATRVTDSQGVIATESLTLTINKRVNIVTESLVFGEVDMIYARRVEAADGVGNYTWSISDSKLPEGLVINASTGEITGTPKIAGTFEFTVKATDSIGGTGTRLLSIEVKPGVSLHTAKMPSGKVGKDYSARLEFSGGNGEYVWILENGLLPEGLALDGNTGAISGTPKTAGSTTFTIELIDSYGSADSKELTIDIEP